MRGAAEDKATNARMASRMLSVPPDVRSPTAPLCVHIVLLHRFEILRWYACTYLEVPCNNSTAMVTTWYSSGSVCEYVLEMRDPWSRTSASNLRTDLKIPGYNWQHRWRNRLDSGAMAIWAWQEDGNRCQSVPLEHSPSLCKLPGSNCGTGGTYHSAIAPLWTAPWLRGRCLPIRDLSTRANVNTSSSGSSPFFCTCPESVLVAQYFGLRDEFDNRNTLFWQSVYAWSPLHNCELEIVVKITIW